MDLGGCHIVKSHQELAAGYRADIDGLRAIAVLSVVFYHAGLPGFSGGFVGVDIFFVISGYLISGIIWRDLGRGRFSLVDFYLRRIRRIFPALCAVLAASSIAAWFFLIPSDMVALGKSLKATVLFYSNFHLLKEVNYFDGPAVDKPLLHTWSLSVEEQFYAVWPLLLLAMARFLPAKRVLPVLLTIAAISLLLAQLKLAQHPKDSFYISYYRMWELMTGAALAIASPLFLRSRVAALAVAAGIAAIAYPVVFYDLETPFPGLTALAPCLGAALIIAGGGSRNPISLVLGSGPFCFFGLISYSLYLIHWPLLSFAHLYLNDILDLTQRMAIVFASVLLSYLSWRFIETPFRVPASSPSRTFLHGAAAAAALCATGLLFVSAQGFPSRVGEKVLSAEALTAKANADYAAFCHPVAVEGLNGGTACVLGNPKKTYDFVLWGDSHALHYAPSIAALAKANNASGLLFAFSSCGPLQGIGTPGCRAFNKSVLDWLEKQASLRTVILASHWVNYSRQFEMALDHEGDEGLTLLSGTLAGLGQLPVSTVVLGQVPEFRQNVSLCMARAEFYNRETGSCTLESASEIAKRYRPVNEYFAALQKRYPFTVVNLLPAFCDAAWCRATDHGEALMRDEHHLTVAGALHAVPYLQIPGLPQIAVERHALAGTKPD
jgi:peptidoglycan/LPS O-acetylase OafA/YrhL